MRIFNNLKRIFHVRQGNSIVENDADISFIAGYDSSTYSTASITFNFNKLFDYIAIRFNTGENANRINKYSSVSSVTKNYSSNQDYNGFIPPGQGGWINNHIYLSDLSLVNLSITVSNSYIFVRRIILKKPFPNLLKISYATSGNGIGGNKSYIDNSWILNAPNLRGLQIIEDIIIDTNFAGIASLPNLKWLTLLGSRLTDINYFSLLPPTLEYLNFRSSGAKTMDLKDWFNGNRMGLSMNPALYPEGTVCKYTGGAIFPSVISEHPLLPIDYIVYQASTIATKISSDQLSRFLVDFANQVTSVNLATKRIRFVGSTPNTSYTDNSQPLFKTYSAALNHITSTLGITVTFT